MIVPLYSIFITLFYWTYADAASSYQIGFQNPATPSMEGILDYPNTIDFSFGDHLFLVKQNSVLFFF